MSYAKQYRPGLQDSPHVHRLVAEAALGKPLPKGAVIHHVDGDGRNNAPSNLVICQDHRYHMLLHQRLRVKRLGGDPNTQATCCDCKQLRLKSDFSKNQTRCKPCAAVRWVAFKPRRRRVA